MQCPLTKLDCISCDEKCLLTERRAQNDPFRRGNDLRTCDDELERLGLEKINQDKTMADMSRKEIEELFQQLTCTDPQYDCEADIRSVLARSAAALRQLLNERKWRPIDKEAKDGSYIWGCCPGWIDGETVCYHGAEPYEWENRRGEVFRISHYMVLPPPPPEEE